MLKLWIAVIELGPARKEPDSFFTTRHVTCQKTIRVCETFTISYLTYALALETTPAHILDLVSGSLEWEPSLLGCRHTGMAE